MPTIFRKLKSICCSFIFNIKKYIITSVAIEEFIWLQIIIIEFGFFLLLLNILWYDN